MIPKQLQRVRFFEGNEMIFNALQGPYLDDYIAVDLANDFDFTKSCLLPVDVVKMKMKLNTWLQLTDRTLNYSKSIKVL